MKLYRCELTLHENLFFATRELGRLYESERYLHNYALAYALGLAIAPYFQRNQIPEYRAQLEPLNAEGIYVTPACPLNVRYDLTTFKFANNAYHVEMVQARRNTPSYGRAKELSVGSRFEFGVLCQGESPRLPRWVRLGLWRSKAEVRAVAGHALTGTTLDQELVTFPLNPLDLADLGMLGVYDLISMRPSSLIDHVRCSGPGWRSQSDRAIVVPQGLAFRVPM